MANFDSNAAHGRLPHREPERGTVLHVIEVPTTELNGPAFPVVAATCPSVFDLDFSADVYTPPFPEPWGKVASPYLDLGAKVYTSRERAGRLREHADHLVT